MQIDITIDAAVSVPPEKSFDYIVPVDLSHIFHRHLLIPGVQRTDEAQPWFTPGLARTVYFQDGSTAREELLEVVPPKSFAYRITNFTGVNKLLLARIDGVWQFTRRDDGGTAIVWTYSLVPRNATSRVVIKLFVAPMIQTFLQRAIDIIKYDLEPAKS